MARVMPAAQESGAAKDEGLRVTEVGASALDERGRGVVGLPLDILAAGKALPAEMLLPRLDGRGRVDFIPFSAAGEVPDTRLVARLVAAGLDTAYFRRIGLESMSGFLEAEAARQLLNRRMPPETQARFVYESARLAVLESLDPELLPQSIYRLVGVADRFCRLLPRHPGVLGAMVRRFRVEYSVATHAVNVGMLSMAMGMGLRMGREALLALGLGALLHDLGKSLLDSAILDKRGPLGAKEWQQMRLHPKLGYDRLRPLGSVPDEALEVVVGHHENLDGSGYPWGVGGEQLGRATRIVRVVDCYDAITSNRSYASAARARDAVATIVGEMSGKVDEEMLKCLIELLVSFSSRPR